MQIWRITRTAWAQLDESEVSEPWHSLLSVLVFIFCFVVPSSCCVPECNQKGPKSLTGEQRVLL